MVDFSVFFLESKFVLYFAKVFERNLYVYYRALLVFC